MHVGADNGEGWDDIEESCSLLELGEDKQSQQECADDVDRDGAFIASDSCVVHRVDSGILDDCVETFESIDPLGKCFDIVVVLQVQIPNFDNTFAASGLFDVSGGSFTFRSRARGEDHAISIESHKVADGFLPKSRVCACHDDCTAGAVGGRVGGCSKNLVIKTLG